MKASSVRDARPTICRPCIPEAVEGGSIPGHNYLELRFTSNSTQLVINHKLPEVVRITWSGEQSIEHETLIQCCFNGGLASQTLGQY